MRAKLSKRYTTIIPALCCAGMIFAYYQYSARSGNMRVIMKLYTNYRSAAINPREVFLLYTRTKKTSSTVAASLIMETYARYGIPTSNPVTPLEARVPGTYASVKHTFFESWMPEKITKVTGKPVILAVSIRDGYGWLRSFLARAEHSTDSLSNGTFVEDASMCDRFHSPQAIKLRERAIAIYMRYLPIEIVANGSTSNPINTYNLTYTPWSVIRHEHVIDDTCELLKRLGMQCDPEAAFGQASVEQTGLDKCNFNADGDAHIIDNINEINRILWGARAENEKIQRG